MWFPVPLTLWFYIRVPVPVPALNPRALVTVVPTSVVSISVPTPQSRTPQAHSWSGKTIPLLSLTDLYDAAATAAVSDSSIIFKVVRSLGFVAISRVNTIVRIYH